MRENNITATQLSLACLEFVQAHAKRNPRTVGWTMNERMTFSALKAQIAALEGEDSQAARAKAA